MSLIHRLQCALLVVAAGSATGCPLQLNCEKFNTFAEARGVYARSSLPNEMQDIVLRFESTLPPTNQDFDGLAGGNVDFLKFCLMAEPSPAFRFMIDARAENGSTQSGGDGVAAPHNPACFYSHNADEPGIEPYVAGSVLVDGELIILRSLVATWRSRDPIVLDVVFQGDTEAGEQWTFDLEVTSGTAGNSNDCAG